MAKRFIITSEKWRMDEGLEKGYGCYLRYNMIMKHLCDKHDFIHRKMINMDTYPYRRMAELSPLPSDTDMIYMWLDTHSFDFQSVTDILNEAPNAKVIWLVGGDRRTWHWGRKGMQPLRAYRPGLDNLLERTDVILDSMTYSWKGNPQLTTFVICQPKHAHKHVFFPNCFVPERAFTSLRYNKEPIMKCVLSGRITGRYELRNWVVEMLGENEGLKKWFAIIRHPSYNKMDERTVDDCIQQNRKRKERLYDFGIISNYYRLDFIKEWRNEVGNIVNEDYARCLNAHYCSLGINGGRMIQIVLMKHVEIPAAGALMLSERFHDLDIAGFVPREHYIKIDANYFTADKQGKVYSNIFAKVPDVLKYPGAYNEIRRNGMEFVRKNHSMGARLKLLDEIIKGLKNGRTVFRNYPKITELGEK